MPQIPSHKVSCGHHIFICMCHCCQMLVRRRLGLWKLPVSPVARLPKSVSEIHARPRWCSCAFLAPLARDRWSSTLVHTRFGRAMFQTKIRSDMAMACPPVNGHPRIGNPSPLHSGRFHLRTCGCHPFLCFTLGGWRPLVISRSRRGERQNDLVMSPFVSSFSSLRHGS